MVIVGYSDAKEKSQLDIKNNKLGSYDGWVLKTDYKLDVFSQKFYGNPSYDMIYGIYENKQSLYGCGRTSSSNFTDWTKDDEFWVLKIE